MSLAIVSENGPQETGLVGRLIGARYRVMELIGRGGMGVVYSARDEQGGPDVVVKFLGSEWTGDPDAAARFEREARRLGALQHPNIVRMIDCGHDDGRAYLVMEFVRGQPLAQRLRTARRLSVGEFVPIAAQILKGVGHAHSRGVVLRDIKASNVMLCHRKGRSDFVVLLDFGLAKRLEGDTPITREHVLGTAGYIAPEALSSEPSGLGVDVYALGVLFWYMLTGAPPFDAEDDAAVLYKTVHSPVPDLRDAIGDDAPVPDRLAALVEQCLAKSPDDRPADANAIVEALIDSVPARMFRLPRAPGAKPSATGEGNTGLIALTGINPSGKHASVPHVAATRSKKRWGLWLAPIPLALAVAGVAYVAQPSADAGHSIAVASAEAVDTRPAHQRRAPQAPPPGSAKEHTHAAEPPAQDGDPSENTPLPEDEPQQAKTDAAPKPPAKPRTNSGRRRGQRRGSSPPPSPAAPTLPQSEPQPQPQPEESTAPSVEPAPEPETPSPIAAIPPSPAAQSKRDVFMRAEERASNDAPALMKPN